MRNKYRFIIPIVLLLLAMLALNIPSIPRWIGLIFLALTAILALVSSQGTVYFSKANRIITEKKPDSMEKALVLYEKADKFGVPAQYALVIGAIFIQYGNIERGKAILESLLKSKNQKLVFQAKISLSMYYWIKRDLDKAIELCESAQDMNLKEKNLYINLGTYYLAKGMTKEFKMLQKDASRSNMDTVPLVDLQIECHILSGDFNKAGNLLTTIFDRIKPAFEDPYMHFAIVYMYYGEVDKAKEYIKECIERVTFSNVTIYKKEDLEKMVSALDDDSTKWAFVNGVLSDILSFVNGNIPDYSKPIDKPSFPPLPNFVAEELTKEKDKHSDEPNTELTEEDEAWLERHQD